MALAPNIDLNLSYGKGGVYFQEDGESGLLHLGNVPKFEATPTIETEDHYSSLAGFKTKDRVINTEKSLAIALDFEEYSVENMKIAFNSTDIVAGAQTAGFLDGETVTPVDDRFVDLGKNNLTTVKALHGAITGGPFEIGETVTGGSSSATGVIAWMDAATKYMELVNVSGTFEAGEVLTGGTSTATATSTRASVVSDVVVVDDAAAPTARYVLGTDYNVDTIGGLFRALSAGSITGDVDISADYPTTVENTIAVLSGSKTQGKILFIGTSDIGPRYRVEAWKCNLTATSAIGLISDAITPVSLNVEVLSDLENHPDSEFCDITEIAVA